jgi:hypothetical protein
MKDKSIRIDDWTGKTLFIGDYDDEKVDEVLQANRCRDCEHGYNYDEKIEEDVECANCNATGYSGDFTISWIDEENNDLNIYEYINY